MADLGDNIFDSFLREGKVGHQFTDGGLGLVVFIATDNAQHFKASVRSDVFLIVGDLELQWERLYADQQFVGDLAEVVEDQENPLFHSVHQGAADVLELSEFLLAHEITQQTVQFHGFVEPDLDIVRVVVFRKVLNGNDALFSQLNVDLVIESLAICSCLRMASRIYFLLNFLF